MDMDDVEVAFLDRAPGPGHTRGKDRNVRNGSVGIDADGAAHRDQIVGNISVFGRGTVKHLREAIWWIERRNNTYVVASRDVLLGERLDVTIDAALVSPRIRCYEGDPHG